jgi:glycosyltransferase involved in cell wall biosynthesis
MRIAFIGQKGIPSKFGGVEKHVEDLSRRLAGGGHEVIVYTRPNYTDPAMREYQGVKLISLPSIGTKHLDAITHTFRAILDVAFREVDLIHFHSIGPSSLIWLAKLLKPNTPVIATFHAQCYYHQKWGYFARAYLKFSELVCCKLADRTVAVSKTLQRYAFERYGESIEYVPNGVEFFSVAGSDRLAGWGLEVDGYIVAVSRLVRHKGLHYLIQAYKDLSTEKKLVIIGDGAHTDQYVQELKELAKDDDRIIFTGNQTGEEMIQLFANAYLFVQPSESEGLSIALLEAMAFGRAVLISDIPENREAAGEYGLNFKNKSIINLRERLLELISNPLLVAENGRNNRERVRTHYNWNEITSEIEQLYQQVLTENNSKKRFARLRMAGKMFGLFF